MHRVHSLAKCHLRLQDHVEWASQDGEESMSVGLITGRVGLKNKECERLVR
jgi:hypothetical protein